MKLRKATFLLLTTPIVAASLVFWFFVQPALENGHRVFLVSQQGYSLTGGYRYASFDGYRLLEKDKRRPLDIGGHLNRLYFNDRYIVGEVNTKPSSRNGYQQYLYFVLDTESEAYEAMLNEDEFERVIEELGLASTVNLVDRDSDLWFKKQ